MSERAFNPHLIIASGSEVVTRVVVRTIGAEREIQKGAVGVVVQSPADNSHPYRVRFADGSAAMLKRKEIALLAHVQRWGLEQAAEVLEEYNLFDHVILRCVMGSRAYGPAAEASDTDRRGVYLAPALLHWSLYGVPEQLENSDTQEVYWELQKFLTLALKANPNILECLLNEDVKLPYVPELVERKLAGPEQSVLNAADLEFHGREYVRLLAELERAGHESTLPAAPSGAGALHDLLIRLRLASGDAAARRSA